MYFSLQYSISITLDTHKEENERKNFKNKNNGNVYSTTKIEKYGVIDKYFGYLRLPLQTLIVFHLVIYTFA